jgi:hypothetical protein
LDTLLEAAERFADRDEIAFCFVGGGSEFKKVQERVQDRSLRNVLCLPYQPFKRLSASLSAADLHVVVMGDKYVGIVHPCKVYNVLAVGITCMTSSTKLARELMPPPTVMLTPLHQTSFELCEALLMFRCGHLN